MDLSQILHGIKNNLIDELTIIEDSDDFYEEAHRKALKLCINKLKGKWSLDDESYFKMICHHRNVDCTTFLNDLKNTNNEIVARIFILFVDLVNRTKIDFLQSHLD